MAKIDKAAQTRLHRQDVRKRVDELGTVRTDQKDALFLAQQLASKTRMDGWTNLLTGLGIAGRDKRTASGLRWTGLLMREQRAEEILASSNLARRIVELLPYEATRRALELRGFDGAETRVQDALDQLDAQANIFKAWCWARTYGGAGLLMMTDEPEELLAEELDLTRIMEVKSLVPLSRWELDVRGQDIETDLANPNFRRPRYYNLSVVSGGTRVQTNVKIHHSRIIRFEGMELPPLTFIKNNYWGDSIFSGLMDSMRDFDASYGGVARVLDEFRMVIHKMPDLAEAFANGKEASIIKRVQAAAASRIASGTLIADKEEEVASDSVTFGGVTDVLERLAARFAAHTEYPKIILFNESPSGLSATGASELMGWYSTVMARQMTYLAPKIDRLLEVLLASQSGPVNGRPPEGWGYEFGILWQETAREKADREKVEAETDDLRLQQGVLDEVDVIEKRYPEKLKDEDPEEMRAKIEEEKQAQAEEQRKQQAAAKPPQPAPKPAEKPKPVEPGS